MSNCLRHCLYERIFCAAENTGGTICLDSFPSEPENRHTFGLGAFLIFERLFFFCFSFIDPILILPAFPVKRKMAIGRVKLGSFNTLVQILFALVQRVWFVQQLAFSLVHWRWFVQQVAAALAVGQGDCRAKSPKPPRCQPLENSKTPYTWGL